MRDAVERNDIDFSRGCFRVRGDVVEVFPVYEEDRAVRVESADGRTWIDDSKATNVHAASATLEVVDVLGRRLAVELRAAAKLP